MPWNWTAPSSARGTPAEAAQPGAWPKYQDEVLLKTLQAREEDTFGLQTEAAQATYLDKASRNFEEEADEALHAEFQDWLQGKHDANVNNNVYENVDGAAVRRHIYGPKAGQPYNGWRHTPWRDRQLTHLEGVREHLRTQAEAKHENELKLNFLAEHGPSNLQEAWIYFKHWVKQRPLKLGPLPTLGESGFDLGERSRGFNLPPPPKSTGADLEPAYWNNYRGARPEFFTDFNETEAAKAFSMGRQFGNTRLSAQNPPPPTAGPIYAPERPAYWNNYRGATPEFFSNFNETQAAKAVSMGRDFGNTPLFAQTAEMEARMAAKAMRAEERSKIRSGEALAEALTDPGGGAVPGVVDAMMDAREDEADAKRPRSEIPYMISRARQDARKQEDLVPNVRADAGPSREQVNYERQEFRNMLAEEDYYAQQGDRGVLPASQQNDLDDLEAAYAENPL